VSTPALRVSTHTAPPCLSSFGDRSGSSALNVAQHSPDQAWPQPPSPSLQPELHLRALFILSDVSCPGIQASTLWPQTSPTHVCVRLLNKIAVPDTAWLPSTAQGLDIEPLDAITAATPHTIQEPAPASPLEAARASRAASQQVTQNRILKAAQSLKARARAASTSSTCRCSHGTSNTAHHEQRSRAC